ncbi:hypothetical protein M9H77_19940 [Catharanthus roseus]|uniref:Uncharacterized protein n=1 Tax=Catharanthus roseus TaxID=4058 RepID=A0ACC0AKS0_CATRO|nr:hypothetical protein M9H77_19940 [Catharanthus roseus]
MASSSSCGCIFRKSIPWIAILAMFSAFSGYGFFFSVTVTSFILTFSTIFFTFSKVQNSVVLNQQEQESLTSLVISKQEEEKEEPKKTVDEVKIRSEDLYSESESNDHYYYSSSSSEEDSSDIDLLGQSPEEECSDDSDSISDEESLIEIALPTGHYVGGCLEKDSKKPPPPPPVPSSIMSAEFNDMMNEEDNLIEIDLSIGSIKCSTFQIQA